MIVEFREVVEIGVAASPGTGVVAPKVDRVEAGVQSKTPRGLAEGRIGHAPIHAQLHQQPRPRGRDQPEGERNMRPERAVLVQQLRRPEGRFELVRKKRVEPSRPWILPPFRHALWRILATWFRRRR